ncbi:unnamed protein product, partial [Didymodactylos carnosus]
LVTQRSVLLANFSVNHVKIVHADMMLSDVVELLDNATRLKSMNDNYRRKPRIPTKLVTKKQIEQLQSKNISSDCQRLSKIFYILALLNKNNDNNDTFTSMADEIILDERNRYVLATVEMLMDKSSLNIKYFYLVYGKEHYNGIERGLVKLGFRKTASTYMTTALVSPYLLQKPNAQCEQFKKMLHNI